jgi:hypothetical protein
MAAIRPKPIDMTALPRYEIVFYPVPDKAYTFAGRYRVNMAALSTSNIYPPGGQPHGETILESCLAAAERFLGGRNGVHAMMFDERLAASVSADRIASSPDFLGYNGDASDGYALDQYGHYSDHLVTYEGQSY